MLYPIGIQSFDKIREGGYAYVDKTALVWKIVKSGGYYFLSRPRRFGKSLLVSAMEAYFSGKRELFGGLAIEKLEQDWIEYPVLHIDFTGKDYNDVSVLDKALDDYLSKWEVEYGSVNRSDVAGIRFGNVIEAAAAKTGQQVVILIDEYDKPVIDNFGKGQILDDIRSRLQGFYSVMKAKDQYIRFGFLTGVTKIGKLSVFSGLNNLKDISMDARYNDICGVSTEELERYFGESVAELAEANGLTAEQCRTKLAEMYDGYHFCEDSVGIYNPFSLLNTFDSQQFKEYWFETGTPTFLVQVMKETSYDVTRLADEEADSALLTDIETYKENPVPLLYQSGYLTIKGYDPDFGIYHLGFPNQEVKHGFLNFLMKYYAPVGARSSMTLIARMTRAIRSGKPEEFMSQLESLFARTPYQIQGDSEKDFQYAMFIILELMGEYVEVERQTSDGRIDILVQTKDYVYIIEIKINGTAEAALRQVEDKGYARGFVSGKRKVFKIGVSFSTDKRCIDEWKVDAQ